MVFVGLKLYQYMYVILSTCHEMITGEWFTSRTSACGLFASAYSKTTALTKEELRG